MLRHCTVVFCVFSLAVEAFRNVGSAGISVRKFDRRRSGIGRRARPLYIATRPTDETTKAADSFSPPRAPAFDVEGLILGDCESIAYAMALRRGSNVAFVIDIVRGTVSLLGIVVLWAGTWLLLDRAFLHDPEEGVTSLSDAVMQAGVALSGVAMMVSTKTFFSNANMDSVDREGSLRELGAILAEGKLRISAKASFYSKCMVAMLGSICWWEGLFNLVNTWTTLEYNAVCATAGAASLLYMTATEDSAADQMVNFDDMESVEKRALQASGKVSAFRSLPMPDQMRLYGRAFFGNVASVVWWKGCEDIEEGLLPDGEVWPGLLLVAGGVFVLWLTDRLTVNSGLALDLENDAARLTPADVDRARIRDAANDPLRLGAGLGAICGRLRRMRMPDTPGGRLLTNFLELVAVTSVWTGIEWYIWDSDLLQHTAGRDAVYVLGSLPLLLATGTLFNQAGMVSPMALYKRVHAYVRHDEDVALLAEFTDDEDGNGADRGSAWDGPDGGWDDPDAEAWGLEMASVDASARRQGQPGQSNTGATRAGSAAAAAAAAVAIVAAAAIGPNGGTSGDAGSVGGGGGSVHSLGSASSVAGKAADAAADAVIGWVRRASSSKGLLGGAEAAEISPGERVPLVNRADDGGGGGSGGGHVDVNGGNVNGGHVDERVSLRTAPETALEGGENDDPLGPALRFGSGMAED